jgi:hypothetical protein
MSNAPSSGTLVAVLPCNDLDASERFYNRLGLCGELKPEIQIIEYSRTAREDISIWQGRRKAGSFREEILAQSIFILKMSTVWPLRCRTYAREDADQRTSHGECMSLQFLIRMKH